MNMARKYCRPPKKNGQDVHSFLQEKRGKFQEAWQKLNILPDDFIYTTDKERHLPAVQKVFTTLLENGDIYLGKYEGWYCTSCETFYTETQLVDKKCPDCGKAVQLLEEDSYFFKLSKYQEPLLEHIKNNPKFIQPESRKNEVIKFIEQGLRDLSITRTSFSHGVPVPGTEGHVVYVWFDALINYISALGFGSADTTVFNKYWPADVHIMGKEIVRFHAVIWPAMLMALGVALPKMVFGHGWWTVEGQKMSKSTGNVVDPLALAAEFGVDATRYFLLREVPFGSDGDFAIKNFKLRFNNDLANDLGNLLNRSLSMLNKYFEGVVPEIKPDVVSENGRRLEGLYTNLPELVDKHMDNLGFSVALEKIWEVIGFANKFIELSAPWTLAKEEKTAELGAVMYLLLEAQRVCATLLEPFMPETADKILAQLNAEIGCSLKAGVQTNKGEPLFPRLEIAE